MKITNLQCPSCGGKLEPMKNQLTNVQFAASLKNLTHLGINNNYVTELSPLNQTESLKYLDIRQNPISGTIETEEDVQILR